MELIKTLPELPKNIIERILNEANLPQETRLYFIDYGYFLTPQLHISKDSLLCFPIEEELYDIFRQRKYIYNIYSSNNLLENKNYNIPQYYMSYTNYDIEINIYEFDDTIYYKFERVYIDYETGDIITIRSIVCNYFTGEMIADYRD